MLQDAEGTEGTEFTRRNRGTEDERSAECGRARNAGSLTIDATQTQTQDPSVGVCAASFVSVTAGYASRRPHDHPLCSSLLLRFSV